MANQLVTLEKSLEAAKPKYSELLRPYHMPVERLIRTIVISAERNPKILECTRASLLAAADSFACLGLEVDGFTGQGHLIPFKVRGSLICQPVIGYKGYNTLAARSGYSVHGAVVREGDDFDFALGTKPFIHHKPSLTGGDDKKIIGAWAVAMAYDKPPIPSVLRLSDLEAIEQRSPAAKSADSPWRDPKIGRPAMIEKSAKRRLARGMPLNTFLLAASMEEAFEERGVPAHIRDDKTVVIDGKAQEVTPTQPPPEGEPVRAGAQKFTAVGRGNAARDFPTVEQWEAYLVSGWERCNDVDILERAMELNREHIRAVREAGHEDATKRVVEAFEARRWQLTGGGDGT